MSTGETVVLVLVIAMFLIFGATLAWASHGE